MSQIMILKEMMRKRRRKKRKKKKKKRRERTRRKVKFRVNQKKVRMVIHPPQNLLRNRSGSS